MVRAKNKTRTKDKVFHKFIKLIWRNQFVLVKFSYYDQHYKLLLVKVKE